MLLQDKTVVVTGGDSGIGAAIVRAAAGAGARVLVDYLGAPDAATELVAEITAAGGTASSHRADVSRVEEIRQLLQTAVERYGRLDVLVNNAGVETRGSVLDTSEEDYQKVLDVNLKSVFFGTQLAAHQFIAQGGGGVVLNVSSVHEEWPMPGNIAYCAAKGGVRMVARTAGAELGQHGIRVLNVGPGAVATPINQSTLDDPDKLRKLESAIPLGRLADPDDIAATVVFLASDRAGYATATTVFLDGGMMQRGAEL